MGDLIKSEDHLSLKHLLVEGQQYHKSLGYFWHDKREKKKMETGKGQSDKQHTNLYFKSQP